MVGRSAGKHCLRKDGGRGSTQPTAQRRASIWNTAGIGGALFADDRYIFGTGPALLATSNIVILYNTLYQQFFF